MLRNTCANGIQLTVTIQSIDTLLLKTNSQAPASRSVEYATATLKVLDLSLGHSLLFDQDLKTNASSEQITKSPQNPVILHLLEQV